MFFDNSYRDNQPLGHIGRMPIYGTTIVVAMLVVGALLTALTGFDASLMMFAFVPEVFWQHAHVWRALTYPLTEEVGFFTIFNLLFIYCFGRDCEQEMGRRRYFAFLGLLMAMPVLTATVLWLCGIGGLLSGSAHLSIGLVIAFATMYPNVEWWASIPLKFIAIGCVFLAIVGHLRHADEVGLISTLATCAVSFAYIRGIKAGVLEGFRLSAFFRRETKCRKQQAASGASARDMDALLDKIVKSGMSSLTTKERARLESARAEMMRNKKS